MKFFLQLCFSFALIYSIICILVYFFQNKMLFFPDNRPFGKCSEMERFNAKPFIDNKIRYYLKEDKSSIGWICVFHGNAGNACDRSYYFELLKEFNINIAVFEYPGYGSDTRKPGEEIILLEALNFIKMLKKKNPSDLPFYLLGESLGTGVATYVASSIDITGLILISPYTSIADLASRHYPWLPVKPLIKNKFLAKEWAGNTDTSVLAFHGKVDDIIPIEFARMQITNFKEPGQLIELEDTGHNDITVNGRYTIQKEINKFMLKNQK